MLTVVEQNQKIRRRMTNSREMRTFWQKPTAFLMSFQGGDVQPSLLQD
jgi:hypothetical protein